MNREEFKAKIAAKLLPKYIDELHPDNPGAWPKLTAAVLASAPAQKRALLEALSQGNQQQAGNVLARMVREDFRAQAEAEADNILADDSISLVELQRIWN